MEGEKVTKVVEKHLKLLALEQDAEQEEQQSFLNSQSKQQLQRRGVALYNLRFNEQRTGLGGKLIVEFGHAAMASLPAHVIKVGDIAQVEVVGKEEKVIQGTIGKVTEKSISVVFRETDLPTAFEGGGGIRILKLANEISFKRMRFALHRLGEITINPLLATIFGELKIKSTLFPLDASQYCDKESKSVFYNQNLNDSQKRAVIEAFNATDLALIHGPPGTGKTETLIEVIRQLVKPKIVANGKGKRVLVCGPSNLSVDNLVSRLGFAVKDTIDIVRIGHPARVMEQVHAHTLDMQLSRSNAAVLVRDIKKEIDTIKKSLSKAGVRKREAYAELKDLYRELREREKGAIESIIANAQVVLTTLSMTGGSLLARRQFDVVIIDEAGQALEAESWLAMLLGQKVIMAGDHWQLPPTVSSKEAEKAGLGITLFERLVSKRKDLTSLLSTQYRMNAVIMEWSSIEFYQNKLLAAESVVGHCLCDLPNVSKTEDTEAMMVFMDTAGFDYFETQEEEDLSKYNEEEAKLVIQHTRSLLSAGVQPSQIAIITPYNAQAGLIETLFSDLDLPMGIEIGSVDGFQGREKEAIIISFVRSNDDGIIGFLSETRRSNVAITRARRQVYMIGDSNTLGRHLFYKRLIEYVEMHGDIRFPTV